MIEDKSKVAPTMEPASNDPCVFDITTQEVVKIYVTQEAFDKIEEMIENPSAPTQDVIERFKRYKAIWNKGELK